MRGNEHKYLRQSEGSSLRYLCRNPLIECWDLQSNGAIIYKMVMEEARCEVVSPGAGLSLLTLRVIYQILLWIVLRTYLHVNLYIFLGIAFFSLIQYLLLNSAYSLLNIEGDILLNGYYYSGKL
jgi:hypothetical protein